MATNIDATKNTGNFNIISRVISRIEQKIKLDNTTKEQISDYINKHENDKVIIRVATELPKEQSDYVKITDKKYLGKEVTIELAYSGVSLKEEQNILYVVITEKEVEGSRKSENKYGHYGYDFILDGIIDRIKKYLSGIDVELKQSQCDQIYDFLAPLVDGKVWVSFEKEMPSQSGYCCSVIELEIYKLHLAYSVNVVDGKFPNSLYVFVVEDLEKKFRKFWKEHYFPLNILDESLKYLDLTQHITICVAERPSLWVKRFKRAKKPIVICQKFDANGKFKPLLPIGYVDGSELALTAPNEMLDNSEVVFTFN